MSCPLKKKQKMADSNYHAEDILCTEEREKPSSLLKSFFNYKFNEAGILVDVTTGDGFNFQVSDDHQYNQERYENLGELITDYVYELLETPEVGLKKMEIPLNAKKNDAKGFIFVSEKFEEKEKLLVLVHGSGVVKAGQWARRLIINDCLDHGTQIPYIKKAIQDGYGVVVLNTNQNHVEVNDEGYLRHKYIEKSESPESHFKYVWKNIIEKTSCRKIFIVAHSYGGYLVVGYFMKNHDVLKRIVAVAFTDSVHSLSGQANRKVTSWFEKNSVNWVTSYEDLDTPIIHPGFSKPVTRVSAGTTKHEETSWKAMNSVFSYFDNKLIDRPKGEEGKGQDGTVEDSGEENLVAGEHVKKTSDKTGGETNVVVNSNNDDGDTNSESNTNVEQLEPSGRSDSKVDKTTNVDKGPCDGTVHGDSCDGDGEVVEVKMVMGLKP